MEEGSEIRRWKTLTREASGKKPGADTDNKGSITIVGSGIMSVGHFTLQALGYIKSCDKVFFCVADPVTETYIKELRPDAMDMYVLYNDDKERYLTYVQMSEVMLHEARKGSHVVGIFYGHPGVFVLPSHRAIQIAEREGLTVKMLPAPSAEDCLFADLHIDPSFPGCQSFEATDLLLRQRHICTDLHVIIWQVGCVGNTGFRFKGYTNDKLHVLIEHLQTIYGNDYELTHYVGAQYPVCDAVKEKIKLSDFSDDQVSKKISGISTFYLPPKIKKETNREAAKALGMQVTMPSKATGSVQTRNIGGYGIRENKAVSMLNEWELPDNYLFSVPSSLSTFLQKLITNPKTTGMSTRLSTTEKSVLASKHGGRIRMTLKARITDVASVVAKRIFSDANFAAGFLATLCSLKQDDDSFGIVDRWLEGQGYQTSTAQVREGMKGVMNSSLFIWSNSYKTDLGPTLRIDGFTKETSPVVSWNERAIKCAQFSNGILTWSAANGNAENAEIAFSRLLHIEDKTKPEHVSGKDSQKIRLIGTVWAKDFEKTLDPNLTLVMDPTSSFPISGAVGKYMLSTKGKGGLDCDLCISKTHDGIHIEYCGREILGWTYETCCLAWSVQDNKENAMLSLVQDCDNGKVTTKIKGKLWQTGSKPHGFNVFGEQAEIAICHLETKPTLFTETMLGAWPNLLRALQQIVINTTSGVAAMNIYDMQKEYFRGNPRWLTTIRQAREGATFTVEEGTAIDPAPINTTETDTTAETTETTAETTDTTTETTDTTTDITTETTETTTDIDMTLEISGL